MSPSCFTVVLHTDGLCCLCSCCACCTAHAEGYNEYEFVKLTDAEYKQLQGEKCPIETPKPMISNDPSAKWYLSMVRTVQSKERPWYVKAWLSIKRCC